MFIKYINESHPPEPSHLFSDSRSICQLSTSSRSLDAPHLAPFTILGRKCGFSGPLKAGNQAPAAGWLWWAKGRGLLPLCSGSRFQTNMRCVLWLHLLPTRNLFLLILLFFSLTKAKNCRGRKTFTLKTEWLSAGLALLLYWSIQRTLTPGSRAEGLAQWDQDLKPPFQSSLPWAPDPSVRGAAET